MPIIKSCLATISVFYSASNSLDPDQAKHFIRPDMDQKNCEGYQ